MMITSLHQEDGTRSRKRRRLKDVEDELKSLAGFIPKNLGIGPVGAQTKMKKMMECHRIGLPCTMMAEDGLYTT